MRSIPHPRTDASTVDRMIALGTAIVALRASSLMCTLASIAPWWSELGYLSNTDEKFQHIPNVHAGAKKDKKNAKPLGQSVTWEEFSLQYLGRKAPYGSRNFQIHISPDFEIHWEWQQATRLSKPRTRYLYNVSRLWASLKPARMLTVC